ncbi:FMN reductase [Actinospica sp. MGRD01-02]|uniref:FMN reductase n=1 Tax=Actinospica acidithermotolerans TaxID=2828514 RepID=A0A941EHC7_9ACTN|nr:FMN reductase [Actinospica acidithermotolerans]MBR7827659.1 FMN reductase [Actinospica acidithermotolerans]
MDALQLIVVSAGLRQPSSTRLLADRLAAAAERDLQLHGRDVRVEVIELRDLAVHIANNLVTGFPNAELGDALRDVEHADGLIVVSPIFSASYSGLFKSFFDLIDPMALSGTPVLIAATGGSARHSLALEHALRPLFSYLHATVVPTAVYAATEDWGGEAAEFVGRIDRAAGELAALLTLREPKPRDSDIEDEDEVIPFEQLLAG